MSNVKGLLSKLLNSNLNKISTSVVIQGLVLLSSEPTFVISVKACIPGGHRGFGQRALICCNISALVIPSIT